MSSTRRTATSFVIAATIFAAVGSVAAGGCKKYTSNTASDLILPDENQFKQLNGVNDFMTQRCAALDCHGQIGRPLRLYSSNGLRLEDGPNGSRIAGPTSDKEKKENYYAVVGLEPEGLTQVAVVASEGGQFCDILLFKKPLDIKNGGVRHKGGPIIRSGDNGWNCITTWVQGKDKFDAKACADAINGL